MVEETFRRPGPAARRGLLGFRIALIALGAVLGLVLIWSGAVIIGSIILAMAVLRAVMVFRVRRLRADRRAAVMARIRQRREF